MPTEAEIWQSVQVESSDAVEPDLGPAIVLVSGTRAGTSKKGERYFAIELAPEGRDVKWLIYKQFTKGGQLHAGSVQSAKITLGQFGVQVDDPSQLEAEIAQLEQSRFAVDVVEASQINNTTGRPYRNINVTGPASPPASSTELPASQVGVQTPAVANGQPTLDQAVASGDVKVDEPAPF